MDLCERATAARKALIYRAEALRAVALPLGGMGTVSVALTGNGVWANGRLSTGYSDVPGTWYQEQLMRR